MILADHLWKNKERIQNFKETRDSITRYIYHNSLDKASFQYSMAYFAYKDLNKILHDKTFAIVGNPLDINVDLHK